MSVLFKALSRAAKTRESAVGAGAPIGQPSILSRGGSRGGNKRMLMLLGALCVGAAGGSYLFFIAGDDSPAPRPAAPKPRPHLPGVAAPAPAPQIATVPAPASAPAPAAVSAPQPAPSLGGPVVAAVPSGEQPAVTLTPMSGTPVPAGVVPPPAGVAQAAGPGAMTASAPVQPAVSVVAPAAPSGKPKAAAPIMPVEEDLPTLLARLRRQKMEPALSQPVSVARAVASRDLVDEDGRSAIQVGVGSQAGQDAAHTAYDDLLQGRYEEALGNYNHALAAEPRNAALLLGKATALQKLGRLADAKKAYGMVLAVEPNNREALTNETTLMATQAPERALTDLRALRQANPGFSPIEAEIGSQEAAAGNIPGAIEAMGRAVQLSPDNGLYRLNLAILQDRAGMGDEAAASYRAALDLLSGNATGLPLPIDQIRRRLAYLERR